MGMADVQKIKEIYDGHAHSYDQMNAVMEALFSKARPIFYSLRGRILEIGTGTGKNLEFYHPDAHVTAIDISPKMVALARHRTYQLGLRNVEIVQVGNAQDLRSMFSSKSFDFVTSTCAFCTIPEPLRALEEVAVVLKPGGYLIQIEHGLSKNAIVNAMLRVVDPLYARIQGTHIARNQARNLEMAGFIIIRERWLDPVGLARLFISRSRRSMDARGTVLDINADIKRITTIY
jgi:ubiquinone/menaquinone biosynthesis C-methylase UbiE